MISLGLDIDMGKVQVKDNTQVLDLMMITGIKLTFTEIGKTEDQFEVRKWGRIRGSFLDMVILRFLGIHRSLD